MNAATLRLLVAKGLSPADLVEVAEAMEVKRDNTAAERQARYRAKRRPRNAVTVTPFPPIEDHTPDSPPSSSNDDDCPPFDQTVVSTWNAGAGDRGLDKARPLNPARKAKLRLRVKEHGEDGVLEAIRKIQASDFHCGLKPGSDWKANLPWLLKTAENTAKALDLPDPGETKHCAVDPVAAAEHAASLYRRMGREEDAKEAEQRAARLRAGSSGPPRSIGEIVNAIR